MKINKCKKCGGIAYLRSGSGITEVFCPSCETGYFFPDDWNLANPGKVSRKSIRKQLRVLEAELYHTDKCMAERLAKVTDQL